MRRLAPAATAAAKTLREPDAVDLRPLVAVVDDDEGEVDDDVGALDQRLDRLGIADVARPVVAFSQPLATGSKGRRAMPITRSTSGARCSAAMNGFPISPVGPVTATVSTGPILSDGGAGWLLQHRELLHRRGRVWVLAAGFSRPHLEDVLAGLQPLVPLRRPARLERLAVELAFELRAAPVNLNIAVLRLERFFGPLVILVSSPTPPPPSLIGCRPPPPPAGGGGGGGSTVVA